MGPGNDAGNDAGWGRSATPPGRSCGSQKHYPVVTLSLGPATPQASRESCAHKHRSKLHPSPPPRTRSPRRASRSVSAYHRFSASSTTMLSFLGPPMTTPSGLSTGASAAGGERDARPAELGQGPAQGRVRTQPLPARFAHLCRTCWAAARLRTRAKLQLARGEPQTLDTGPPVPRDGRPCTPQPSRLSPPQVSAAQPVDSTK